MLQAADAMRVMADKAGVTLSVSPISPGWSDRIIQTLTNLLSNATSEGLQFVDCRVGNLSLDKAVGRPLLPYALLPTPYPYQVPGQDQGGIPADKIEKL